MKIQDLHSTAREAIIYLYEIEVNSSTIFRFTPYTNNGALIMYAGNEYLPVGINMRDFIADNEATLDIYAPSALINGYIRGNSNFVGAKITRFEIMKEYLDGEANADTTAIVNLKIHYISTLLDNDTDIASWTVISPLKANTAERFPHIVALKDHCRLQYRAWNADTNSFDYQTNNNGCPYVGSTYYDADGEVVTNPEEDVASKVYVTCCAKRFENLPKPYGGFLGLRGTKG